MKKIDHKKRPVIFVCDDCKGELVFDENGYKNHIQKDPRIIGAIVLRIRIFKATCPKCGKTTNNYFCE